MQASLLFGDDGDCNPWDEGLLGLVKSLPSLIQLLPGL